MLIIKEKLLGLEVHQRGEPHPGALKRAAHAVLLVGSTRVADCDRNECIGSKRHMLEAVFAWW
jgi:hypothetical protein